MTARMMRWRESWRTCQNFSVPVSCLMTAVETIPPASATMKYDPISGMPWSIYLKRPNGICESCPCVNIPIAAAITLAFQARTNMTPAPKMSEKMRVKTRT